MKEGKLTVDFCFNLNHWGLHRDSSLTLLLWHVEVTEILPDERRIQYFLPAAYKRTRGCRDHSLEGQK